MINTVAEKLDPEQSASVAVFLVRYGAVPEVARFTDSFCVTPARGESVVVQTHRGLQVGTVLERLKPSNSKGDETAESEFHIERITTAGDRESAKRHSYECDDAFPEWCARILQWNLNLELIDLEWTLDRQKLILYVLCERGPDSTKLALQAAAAGLGLIEVQPVSAAGLVQVEAASSCGSGGGGCGCSH